MVRSWVKLIWNSVGVAVVAAAAQLAIAQALGIIRWERDFRGADQGLADQGLAAQGLAGQGGAGAQGWSALLTWIAFIFAVSVLGGAAVGRRAVRRPGKPDGTPARIAAALSAGVGAGLAAAIAWLPARAARPPINVHPELVVAVTAGAGVIAGILVALAALTVPPVAGGVRAAVAWIWFVGVGSAIAGQMSGRPIGPPRLAVIDAPSAIPVAWWSGPYTMIAVSFALGVGVAAVARWADAHRFGIAVSGVAGPAVIAAAYLIAGPGAGADSSPQLNPYRASLIAVGVGLIASVLVAVPGGQRASGRTSATRSTQTPVASPVAGPAPGLPSPYEQDPYNLGGPFDQPPLEPAPLRAAGSEGRAARLDASGGGQGAIMGQPPPTYEEDYSEWLRDLGHVPGQQAPTGQ